jgi:signal transduction histidine kinase
MPCHVLTERPAGRFFNRYISHEMRTPLSAAAMGLSLLEDDIEQVP